MPKVTRYYSSLESPVVNLDNLVTKNKSTNPKGEGTKPFGLIPNVKNIVIRPTDLDLNFADHGIIKRKNKAHIELEPYKNHRGNRYIKYKLKYLKKLNDKQYWNAIDNLMRYSAVFWLLALKKTVPEWYKDYPLWYILKTLKNARKLHIRPTADLVTTRVYIDKANGGKRPLGVPRLDWRIYLCLFNFFLVFRLKRKVNVSQHGFIPGRGCMTAWKQILKEVVQSENIYEIDLKNAFNSLKVSFIAQTLYEVGLSKGAIDKILRAVIAPTIFLDQKYIESDYHAKRWTQFWDYYITQNLRLVGCKLIKKELKGYETIIYENGKKMEMPIYKDDPECIWESTVNESKMLIIKYVGNFKKPNGEWYYQDPKLFEALKLKDTYAASQNRDSQILDVADYTRRGNCGVPQGASISPFIFALCVNKYFFGTIARNGIKCVAYADDAVFYGRIKSEEQILKKYPKSGLEINTEKSGWVKKEGTWLKDLKFLGMRYIHKDGVMELTSDTRASKKLSFNKEALLDAYTVEKLIQSEEPTMDDLAEMIKKMGVARYGKAVSILIGVVYDKKKRKNIEIREWHHHTSKEDPDLTTPVEEVYKELLKSSVSLEFKLANSSLFGFIQSRQYIGDWNYEIEQDFSLKYHSQSYLASRMSKFSAKINTFNASSYCYHALLEDLRRKVGRIKKGRLARRYTFVNRPLKWIRKKDQAPKFIFFNKR